jgi:hypothetical protein
MAWQAMRCARRAQGRIRVDAIAETVQRQKFPKKHLASGEKGQQLPGPFFPPEFLTRLRAPPLSPFEHRHRSLSPPFFTQLHRDAEFFPKALRLGVSAFFCVETSRGPVLRARRPHLARPNGSVAGRV